MNNVIIEANQNQVTDQVHIHEVIEANVIKQQESEYIKAIYNTGEYRLAPRYRRYAVDPLEWSRKTDKQGACEACSWWSFRNECRKKSKSDNNQKAISRFAKF